VSRSRRGFSSSVTAVIAAHNESANIEACIATLDWAKEVIVVENDSSDDTVARARAAGATVMSPAFSTIGAAFNNGIERAQTEWIYIIAADERCTPELAAEIREVLARPSRYTAFRVRRRNFFLGKEIRYGGWGADRSVRLFRREMRFNASQVHEDIDVVGEIGDLRQTFLHYTYPTLDHYFEKFDRYSKAWAAQNFAKGRRCSALPIFFKPPAKFVTMYFLKGGFLDGARGVVLASLAAASVTAKYARLWALSRQARADS
jgi:glycosyltransferase involved in cell wall biosynthesis